MWLTADMEQGDKRVVGCSLAELSALSL